MIRMGRALGGLASVVFATVAVGLPGSLTAQDADAVRDSCLDLGGGANRCTDAVVAARVIGGQFGLLAGWGSEIPGSASTLGRKIGTRPRLSISARAGALSMGLPDLFDEGTGAAPDVSFVVPSVRGEAAFGLLDGFSPAPTVGGVLSIDLLGSLGLVMPPSSQGFDGTVTVASLGARVGLLRESFTLPGVSVSVARRFVGGSALGRPQLGDPAGIEVDPELTSVRATVGKDLFGIGWIGGVGWDDTKAQVVVEVERTVGPPVRVASSIEADRRLYFAGASMTFLLLQLSVEGGWAEGHPALSGSAGSTFDSESGSAFGSLALRFMP